LRPLRLPQSAFNAEVVMNLGQRKNRRRELVELLDHDLLGLLEPGVEVQGKIKVPAGLLRLNTHFTGEIVCEGLLVVAEEGEVEADIQARLVSISGKVKGSIHASERLEIKEHGVVLGDIFTPCLVIDPGGYFDGQCHMPTPSPEPEKQASSELESLAA